MVTSTWVYTPKSGTINQQIELAKKFVEIWKKYGAKEVNLYALSGAQMGNLAFTARFENAAAWDSAWDEVNQDEDFSEIYNEAVIRAGSHKKLIGFGAGARRPIECR